MYPNFNEMVGVVAEHQRKLVAAKPYTTHPEDTHLWVVVTQDARGEFAVHNLNTSDRGLSSGNYYRQLGDAMGRFQQRGV